MRQSSTEIHINKLVSWVDTPLYSIKLFSAFISPYTRVQLYCLFLVLWLYTVKIIFLKSNFNIYRVSKKYAKLVKRNLKLVRLIYNMLLFFNFAQSNLNFELLCVGIHQVLKDKWLFEHQFQVRNFCQL